jgi:hypothetical protein
MRPFYRIYTTPTVLRRDRVNPTDERVASLLARPPATRENGWIIWPMEVAYDDIQFTGQGIEGARLVLLFNGHLEYSEPVDSRRWQWGRGEEEAARHPELYPYALGEITVSFYRLARQLYDHVRLDSDIETELGLYNIEGFTLRPYQPGIIGHDDPHFHNPSFARADLKTGKIRASADFSPDQLALSVLERVYGQFKYRREHIPFFDQEGKFALK